MKLMKLVFVDAASNRVDGYRYFTEYCDANIAGSETACVTAPELMKLPVAVKKAFNEGAETVVAFATASGDEGSAMDLVSSKLLDVEIEAVRYAYLVVVFQDEYRSHEQLEAAVKQKIEAVLDQIAKGGRGSQPQEQDEAAATMPDLGFESSEGGSGAEGGEPAAEDMHSLF